MKTEKEIRDKIKELEVYRDVYVVGMVDWIMFNFAIKELEWVIK